MSAGADLSGLNSLPRAVGRSGHEERADFLAYLDRRIGNAAAVERSTAPDAETRELAGDRRRQLEVIRDEIAQGMHQGEAAVAAKLRQDAMAAVLADLGSTA